MDEAIVNEGQDKSHFYFFLSGLKPKEKREWEPGKKRRELPYLYPHFFLDSCSLIRKTHLNNLRLLLSSFVIPFYGVSGNDRCSLTKSTLLHFILDAGWSSSDQGVSP